jgi:hypothetical protein
VNERLPKQLHYDEHVDNQSICPRCDAALVINYDECQCLYCGYVDYSYEPPQPETAKKSIVNTATLWVVRYKGNSEALNKSVIHVKLERNGYCVAYKVNCPYCKGRMHKSSRRSSRRMEKREERHKCTNGHIVTLTWSGSGDLAWK